MMSTTRKTSSFLGLCVLFLFLSSTFAFHVTIPYPDKACFHEDLVKGQVIFLSYSVSFGGNHDVDFWVNDPNNKAFIQSTSETVGQHKIVANMDGKISYCFSNRMNSAYDKVVQFSIYGLPNPFKKIDDKSASVDPILEAVNKLSLGMHGIKEDGQYLITRERTHRETVESANARALWWSIFQSLIIVLVMLVQIYFLKQYFEVKRVV